MNRAPLAARDRGGAHSPRTPDCSRLQQPFGTFVHGLDDFRPLARSAPQDHLSTGPSRRDETK